MVNSCRRAIRFLWAHRAPFFPCFKRHHAVSFPFSFWRTASAPYAFAYCRIARLRRFLFPVAMPRMLALSLGVMRLHIPDRPAFFTRRAMLQSSCVLFAMMRSITASSISCDVPLLSSCKRRKGLEISGASFLFPLWYSAASQPSDIRKNPSILGWTPRSARECIRRPERSRMLSCSQILRFAVPKRPKASLISGSQSRRLPHGTADRRRRVPPQPTGYRRVGRTPR